MSNQPPRVEVPITDDKGRITRWWYKYLVDLGKSTNNSEDSSDDLQSVQNLDAAANYALLLQLSKRIDALEGQWLMETDKPQRPDNDLFAMWPGNTI